MAMTATQRVMLHVELQRAMTAFKSYVDERQEEPTVEPEDAVRASSDAMCLICLDALPSALAAESMEVTEDAHVALHCGHAYCKACIKQYVTTKIDNREIEAGQLTCPALDCKQPLDAMDLLKTTTEAAFLKYLRFQRDMEFEKMPHGRHCPSATCNAMIECNPSEKTFQCPTCKTKGCFKCGNTSHPFRTCDQALDRMYVSWERSVNASCATKAVSPCPNCSYRIWKNEGCQHMTCRKCRHEWCWCCGITWQYHNNWMAKRYCWLTQMLASRRWGPCLPVRIVTQSIALTLLTAGVFVGGVTVAASFVVGVPLALLYLVPRQLIRTFRRYRFGHKRVKLHYLAEKVQRGTHIFVHSESPLDWATVLPSLSTSGGWRGNNPQSGQYVAYVASPEHGSFVAYLSSAESTLLDATPGYFRAILMPSPTAALPPPGILDAIAPPNMQERRVALVYDTEEMVVPEVQTAVRTLADRNLHVQVLFVPRGELVTAPEYMTAVYAAIFNATPRQ
ncbi:hypothetical protein ACHHYP_14772 [Achlya hypogyna]|uniref:RBR-type E3 ubiquitin transferase n=1 Tax=Achlya hypogyna TaxID=1202772 RepID=A0A1V9YCC5_ACHHY|nr:hypothetical protein ACHHYP_14772 [Achlya hypogyna]